MEIAQLIVTVLVCLFGSGGLVLYLLKRKDNVSTDIAEKKESLSKVATCFFLSYNKTNVMGLKTMKTKEELEQIKEEYVELNTKLAELSEDELKQITGGVTPDITPSSG